jgi:hypothetical protein
MNKLEIVPFGKYKGQPMDVLAQDAPYCEWLAEQEWFRSRYPAIHTLIINDFGQPEETPEHNALQALFVDKDFCARFVFHILGGQPHVYEIALKKKTDRIVALERWLAGYSTQAHAGDPCIGYQGDRRVYLSELKQEFQDLTEAQSPEIRTDVEFESHGADVFISYKIYMGPLHCLSGEARVECKPSVGDDYPAVLRQMFSPPYYSEQSKSILSIGPCGYAGAGATFEQVKAIFKSRRIDIVLQEQIQ